MFSALLARYKAPRDKHFSEVTGVTEVQASNGKAFACYSKKFAGVTEVTPRANELLSVTHVTPCYTAEVTTKPLPILGCTPVTSVTSQKQQRPQENETGLFSWGWLIYYADRAPVERFCVPEATRNEIFADDPEALTAEPIAANGV